MVPKYTIRMDGPTCKIGMKKAEKDVFHPCMRALIIQDRYVMDLSLYRSKQLVKWSPVNKHILLRFV